MDKRALKAEMILQDVSLEDICEAAGFSRAAWFRKISGVSEFTQSEISAIAKLLHLSQDKIIAIFFNEKVS